MNTSLAGHRISRAGIAAVATLLKLLGAAPVGAQEYGDAVPTSRLTGIALPASAQRLQDETMLAQLVTQLEALAVNAQRRSAFPEVLVWTDHVSVSPATIEAVAEALQKTGYAYEEQSVPGEQGVEVRVLAAEKNGKQVVGFWITTADYLLLGWCQLLDPQLDAVSSAPVTDRVLVPGDPPLTEGRVNQVNRLLEWVLDASLTNEQRGLIQGSLVQAWQASEASRENALQLLQLHDQVMALTEEQRSLLLAKAQPEVLQEWRQQTQDETIRWALAIYEAAHQPIAPGNPPLTRQVCDAYTELVAFMVSEVTGTPWEASREDREKTTHTFVANYGRFSPEQQLGLSRLPMLWATIRAAWPKASEQERAEARQGWAEALRRLSPQPQASARGEQAMRELDALLPKVQQGQLTPAEKDYAADRMEIVAEELRQLGGGENAAQAAQWMEHARSFREQARSPDSPTKGMTLNQTVDYLMARERQQHNAYVSMYNAALTSHAGTMNMISIMSGSADRWSVR